MAITPSAPEPVCERPTRVCGRRSNPDSPVSVFRHAGRGISGRVPGACETEGNERSVRSQREERRRSLLGLFSLRKAEQPPAVDRASAGGAQLGFAAVRQSTDWKLTWRRAAVFALEPSGATLTIRDGGTEQQLGLGLEELAIGSIVYTPHSGDVSFSLAVTSAGRPAMKERIRVLDPGFVAPALAAGQSIRTATRVGPQSKTLPSR